jgi:hypothetical protein
MAGFYMQSAILGQRELSITRYYIAVIKPIKIKKKK